MKIREIFQDRIITFSNLLTSVRIIAGPFLGYFIYKESQTGDARYLWYEVIVVAIIIISDFFDGFLARLMNQVTKLGQYLDPMADKLAGLIAMVFLVLYKGFPLWVLIVALTREVLAVAAGIILYTRVDVEVRPNIFGKFCAASLALAGTVYILNCEYSLMGVTIKDFSIFLVILLYVLGGILYIKSYAGYYLDKKKA